jgi:hypothetical protein
MRSPRSAALSELDQKASAAVYDSGCMKLTEPPFATVSISISLSIAQISGEELRALIWISDMRMNFREVHFR